MSAEPEKSKQGAAFFQECIREITAGHVAHLSAQQTLLEQITLRMTESLRKGAQCQEDRVLYNDILASFQASNTAFVQAVVSIERAASGYDHVTRRDLKDPA